MSPLLSALPSPYQYYGRSSVRTVTSIWRVSLWYAKRLIPVSRIALHILIQCSLRRRKNCLHWHHGRWRDMGRGISLPYSFISHLHLSPDSRHLYPSSIFNTRLTSNQWLQDYWTWDRSLTSNAPWNTFMTICIMSKERSVVTVLP